MSFTASPFRLKALLLLLLPGQARTTWERHTMGQQQPAVVARPGNRIDWDASQKTSCRFPFHGFMSSTET